MYKFYIFVNELVESGEIFIVENIYYDYLVCKRIFFDDEFGVNIEEMMDYLLE